MLNAKPKPKSPFFAIPSEDWVLKAPQLSLQLKNMASYLGIDFTRTSTLSLQIGGASTLAAAGLADNEIMRIGAWRSTTFLNYIRESSQLFEKARATLVGSGAMTLYDVKRLDTATTTKSSRKEIDALNWPPHPPPSSPFVNIQNLILINPN